MSPADVPMLNLMGPALGVYLSNSPNIFVSDMTVLSIERRTKCRIEIYSKERGEGR